MNPKNKKIIMLATECDTTNILYNYLSEHFSISFVILEKNPSKIDFLKRRIKKLGIISTLGQMLFILFISKPQRVFSRNRIKDILKLYNLKDNPIPLEKKRNVDSVNSKITIEFLKNEAPDIVIINGTRIISENILSCVNSIFINIHTGITPLYRGVHGGYWALASGDIEHFGVTIHLVDKGIDTGNVLKQEITKPLPNDNFSTYPYLQYAIGCKLFKEVLIEGAKEIKPMTYKSKLWHHPTLFQYLKNRILRNIK